MAFDSLTLKILTQEFQNSIIGGKINKIYQPEKDEVVLCIYNKVSYKLLLSANAGINRIHFTEYAPENPLVAPNFCMLLRKHLLNATILSINQQPYERVIDFLLENKNELGYTENKHLIFELTGKTSNIILTSEEYTILDTVKHLPQDINSDRLMYNGAKYAFFAPQNKISPFNYEGIANLLSTTCLPIRQLLVDNLLGVSTQTVNEMMSGIDENLHNDLNTKRILDSIHIVENNFNTPRPNVVYKDSEPIDVCPFEMTRVKGDKEFYPLLNTAHDKYFYLKDKQQRFKDKAKTVSTIVKNAISRTEKKIAIQLQGALDAGEYEETRVYGDLILSNIHAIKSNADTMTCINYYDATCPTVTIPLDATLSPQQNAQKYFKKYRKQKSTVEHNSAQAEENAKFLDYLKTVSESLRYCNETSDLQEITEELTNAGLIRKQRNEKRVNFESKPLKYFINGFVVFVGKNNIQNDNLTFHFAKPNDLWLHTEKIHSAHAIIVTDGKSVDNATIETVAEIVAFYSANVIGGKTSVVFTEKSNVKRAHSATLGLVNYVNEKSLIVSPDRHDKLAL